VKWKCYSLGADELSGLSWQFVTAINDNGEGLRLL